MNKLSIVFVVTDYDVGGITTSLRNITDFFVKNGHRVGIVNLAKTPILPVDYNNHIEIVNLIGIARLWDLNKTTILEAPYHKKPCLIVLGILKKILNKTRLWQELVFSRTNILGYDVAVAFRQGPLEYNFVNHQIKAKVKIGFWHGDPDYMLGIEKWDSCIQYMDYIACVSNAVRDKMIKKYPYIAEKMATVYNIFDAEYIIKNSNSISAEIDKEIFQIVTVSRIDFEQKQIHFIPQICKNLKNKGYTFSWTVIGGGECFEDLQRLVQKEQVEDCLFLANKQMNPYPYVKRSDLFVLTSNTEAYGMVLVEALILGVPCVSTFFPALPEVIRDRENGIIAENSISGLQSAIEELLTNKGMYQKLKENSMKYKYDPQISYEQFMDLCELEDNG